MRFIHAADIHLGAVPDRDCPWSEKRSQEIWDTFRDLIGRVKEEKADLLLIAGDLFHRQPLMRELKEVNYLFSKIPETRVIWMAGNHDCLKPDSYYYTCSWADNVVCFFQETPSAVYLEELQTYVYGLSYHHREIEQPLYDNLRPDSRRPGIHILLAHGGDEKHIPIQKRMLAAAGFDYVALGHIHKPEIFSGEKMAYAGALEPIDKNDTGNHGYILGQWEKGEISLSFVPFARRSYVPLSVEVTPDMGQMSLEETVRRQMLREGEDDLFRIVLQGRRDPEWEIDSRRLQQLPRVVDVKDDTRPEYSLEEICREYRGSLVGAYAQYFMDRERTEVEDKALYYGLSALLDARQ